MNLIASLAGVLGSLVQKMIDTASTTRGNTTEARNGGERCRGEEARDWERSKRVEIAPLTEAVTQNETAGRSVGEPSTREMIESEKCRQVEGRWEMGEDKAQIRGSKVRRGEAFRGSG